MATPDPTCIDAAGAQRVGEDVAPGPGGFGPIREFECESSYAWAARNHETKGYAPLTFLPLSPGKFLVELACGGGAYNTRNAYLFYDETATPPVLKRLRFPYYNIFAGGNDATQNAVPQKVWVTVVSSRVFNRRRKELIVLLKGRGLGISAVLHGTFFATVNRYSRSSASSSKQTTAMPFSFRATIRRAPKDGGSFRSSKFSIAL